MLRASSDSLNCEDSLQDSRRTANAGFGEFKPDFRDDVFFLQKSDRREDRSRMARDNGGSGTVRRPRRSSRKRIGPIWVVMGRLRGRCP